MRQTAYSRIQTVEIEVWCVKADTCEYKSIDVVT